MVQSANQCPCNHEQHASDLQRPKNKILITSCPYISTNIDPPPSQLQSLSKPPTRKIVKHALGGLRRAAGAWWGRRRGPAARSAASALTTASSSFGEGSRLWTRTAANVCLWFEGRSDCS